VCAVRHCRRIARTMQEEINEFGREKVAAI
jgi:hypothetical protein